ncbi:hypothetical protein AOT82_1336 [Psychrobacter sp. AntiMn-1]|nr:hypothetical protein AOT82_1336 [Psychrobacter sp. AntiMn-1]
MIGRLTIYLKKKTLTHRLASFFIHQIIVCKGTWFTSTATSTPLPARY